MRVASLILSIVALAVAGLALWRAPGPLMSTGRGMDAYDLSTPQAAWHAMMQIEEEQDFRALVELGMLRGKERRETSKLVEAVPFEDAYILFVTYEEDGKTKHQTVGMRKIRGTDVWAQDYIGSYKVGEKDKDLGERMKDWERKSED